ncbi:putative hydrolase PNKD [Scleropages formosus]|uniref:Putative hydrolase PNKD n=1 Tax=Scleropages formosus TaxID=113540 RepID=A0A0P7X9T8_SCLFO|nr:putative hydrolase PNKD [Scleropages formosus]
MAAPCVKYVGMMAVKALDACGMGSCLRLPHSRLLHCHRGAPLMCAKKESPKSQDSFKSQPEELEYIPKKKAKNPMIKIGYAWMIGLPSGIIGFFLAKRQVDKNRLKQLKIRQRMRKSNEGSYESERYGTVIKSE